MVRYCNSVLLLKFTDVNDVDTDVNIIDNNIQYIITNSRREERRTV